MPYTNLVNAPFPDFKIPEPSPEGEKYEYAGVVSALYREAAAVNIQRFFRVYKNKDRWPMRAIANSAADLAQAL